MKLAIAYNKEKDTVFQKFENAEYFKLYEIDGGEIDYTEIVGTMGKTKNEIVEFLLFLEADVVICGDISAVSEQQILDEGILLYKNCSGKTEKIFKEFSDGTLLDQ